MFRNEWESEGKTKGNNKVIISMEDGRSYEWRNGDIDTIFRF